MPKTTVEDFADLVLEQEKRAEGSLDSAVPQRGDYHHTVCGNKSVIERPRVEYPELHELWCLVCRVVVWPMNIEEESEYRVRRLIRLGETEESARNIVELQQKTEKQAKGRKK